MRNNKKVIDKQNSNEVPSSAGEHIRLYTDSTDTNITSSVGLDVAGSSLNSSDSGNSKKSIKLFLAIFIALITISTAVALYFTPENSFDTRSNASDVEDTASTPSDNYEIGSSSLPKLINVPPSVVHVGSKYNFTMRISDTDTDIQDITVLIRKGPSWLSIDGFTLSGIPIEDTGEAQEVIVTISDGENTVEEVFFIFVEPSLVVYPDDSIVYELHD